MIRIIAALFATMLVAADTDWLLYRGNPTQTGVATGKLPDELGILWTVASEDSIEGASGRRRRRRLLRFDGRVSLCRRSQYRCAEMEAKIRLVQIVTRDTWQAHLHR